MILWSIKNRLSSISRRAAPDRGFVLSLRNKLQEAGYVETPRFTLWKMSWKRAAVSFSILLSVGFGATATYAYESPDVLPDHPLYGLRVAMENVELKAASTPEAKENVRLKQLSRHLRDTKNLALAEKPLVVEQTKTVLNELSTEIANETAISADAGSDQSDQEDYLRATVATDKQDLADIADEQKDEQTAAVESTSTDEADKAMNKIERDSGVQEKRRIKQALVEIVDRAQQHIKDLRDHQRMENRQARVLVTDGQE